MVQASSIALLAALMAAPAPEAGAVYGPEAAPVYGPGQAPTPDPAPEAGAVYGPGPAPLVVTDVPTPAALRPPPPRWDGRGLFIAAGIMGGLNIGLAAARLGLGLGEPSFEREQARLILTAGVMPINVAAGIGLAAGGGHLRGRQDGYRTAFDRAPKLRAHAFIGSGTILLVMGAVAWASAWTPWHGDATLEGRGGGSLVVESVGSLLLMAGTGLTAYGVSWKKHSERYGRSLPISLQPAFGPGRAGLALVGRF